MSNIKFKIYDWAHNELFNGKEFADFETAWSFIYEQFPNEEEFDDHFVLEVSNE